MIADTGANGVERARGGSAGASAFRSQPMRPSSTTSALIGTVPSRSAACRSPTSKRWARIWRDCPPSRKTLRSPASASCSRSATRTASSSRRRRTPPRGRRRQRTSRRASARRVSSALRTHRGEARPRKASRRAPVRTARRNRGRQGGERYGSRMRRYSTRIVCRRPRSAERYGHLVRLLLERGVEDLAHVVDEDDLELLAHLLRDLGCASSRVARRGRASTLRGGCGDAQPMR